MSETRAWGLKLPSGHLAAFILLAKRAPVIAWACWNYGETGGLEPSMWDEDFDPNVWRKLRRRGYRVVPVIVREVARA